MNSYSGGLEPISGNSHNGATQLFFAPSLPLRGHISHYTVQLRNACELPSARPLTIIPDASGCLVFTVSHGRVKPVFWGPNSETHQVTRDFNTITLRLLVEFLPGGAFGLFGRLPLHELQNSQCLLDAIDPALDRLFRSVVERHYAAWPVLLQAVDDVLVRRLGAVAEKPLLRQVLSHASPLNGNIRLNTLTGMTSYSARHINRLCQERIGVSWKSFVRILRINEACRRIRHGVVDLRTLACDLDFHDQAHFSKDFKALCGVTPSDYQRDLPHFYAEETKLCMNLPDRYAR
ncbi:helix-turn-helix domain-containing protein [Trabulsiella odontotermitis]|uniref:helix-turn-helix domain-containing protein n=1 Tax=Trabulsiella odontotermitis TaxID=379893 RepID=UPI000AE8E06C|nr:helix-turn-helix domain-containing protein [Trabulsiella odontotermitis]